MNKKIGLYFWIGVLMVFLAGSCFVGYKLWRRQKDRALMAEMQRWEIKADVPLPEGLTTEQFEAHMERQNVMLDRYEVLRPVVDELSLVTFWGVPDTGAAVAKLKESSGFREGEEAGTMWFVVADKDKEMTGLLREALGRSFDNMLRRDRFLPPPPPADVSE